MLQTAPAKALRLVPRPQETLLVLVCTSALSILLALLVRPLVLGTRYGVLISWASHLPQLIVPWAWYHFRVAPALKKADRPLLRRAAGNVRLFWIMLLVLGGSKFIGEAAASWGAPRPAWASAGLLPILLVLLFQGVMVGFSEEMLNRPALHLPLQLTVPGTVRVGRLAVSRAMLLTALLFGLLHLPNLLLGASLVAAIAQSAFAAFMGLILGYYYERTSDYAGTAMLHNVVDVSSYLAVLVVTR